MLIHFLREKLSITGPHIGCETTHCGACTVDFDGMSVKSCTVLTVQAEGAEVLTIEGLAQGGALHALQEGFTQEHGLQCGFCTPGMIMRAYRLLQENPNPRKKRSATGWPAICAAARAIRTSSRPCNTRREAAVGGRSQDAAAMNDIHPRSPPNATDKLARHGLLAQAREDSRFIQGKGTYVDDIKLPGMLFGDYGAQPLRSCPRSSRSTSQGAGRCRASSRC